MNPRSRVRGRVDCNDAETLGLLLIMSSSMTLSGVGQQTSMRPGGHRRSEGIKLSGWFRRRDEAAAMHAKRKNMTCSNAVYSNVPPVKCSVRWLASGGCVAIHPARIQVLRTLDDMFAFETTLLPRNRDHVDLCGACPCQVRRGRARSSRLMNFVACIRSAMRSRVSVASSIPVPSLTYRAVGR